MLWRASLTSRPLALAVVASSTSVALLVLCLVVAPDSAPRYLAWNLVIAWIPLALSGAILRAARGAVPGLGLLLGAAVWLLFLPNAPYLLTDLVHIEAPAGGASAIDLVVLTAVALTGPVLFFASVVGIHEAARLRFGRQAARGVVPACVWLSSVGIYLGRVLRWNSWDVIDNPAARIGGLLDHLRDPTTVAVAVAFVVGTGVCLHLAYITLGRLASPEAHP